MYEAFYGLHSKPFQLNPDPEFYFGSKQHRRARAYLEYGVHRNEGFIVITGEVGAGKTTVVRGLLAGLDSSKVVSAHLVTTQLDAEDVLRLVGAAFGVRVKDIPKADVLMALEAYLVQQTRQGRRCLLIVDEAQNLSQRAVEELRMLSNFQYGQQALLQTFLVGQPEFRAILQSPAMQQLKQRVTAASHIGPLDAQDTQCYIEHRLRHSGSSGRQIFDAPALEAIHKASGGIPRRINLTCERALLLGFLGNKETLGVGDISEVVAEINDESSISKVSNSQTACVSPELNLATQAMVRQIQGLGLEQYDARVRRLENSMLRLERINLEILAMLQKLAVGMSVAANSEIST